MQQESVTHATPENPSGEPQGPRPPLPPLLRMAVVVVGLIVVSWAVLWILPLDQNGENARSPETARPTDEADLESALRALALERESRAPELASFYRKRNYAACWTAPQGLDDSGRRLVRRLAVESDPGPAGARSSHDLAFLDVDLDEDELSALEAEGLVELEWRISQRLIEEARALAHGRLDPSHVQSLWHHRDEAFDVQAFLDEAARRDPVLVLEELRLAHETGTGLEAALELYTAIDRSGGWDEVPPSPELLELGTHSPAVGALRARLWTTGDLAHYPHPATDAELFEEPLDEAVRRFQRRHGLAPDGRVGKETRDALNVPSADRVRQIRVNLERRRWLPADFGEEYIWINVPEYRLYTVRDRRPALRMNVVVGKDDMPTPLFTDRLSYVVFNPYWNVPESIAIEELLPKQRDDSSYLRSQGFEAVDRDAQPVSLDLLTREAIAAGDVRIRRRPGPLNDLGRVKFMLPNEHNVYLHDTPQRGLFSRTERASSHGCIRVERPMELAAWVLGGRAEGQVDETRVGEEPFEIRLEESIPVYIVYFTAFVSDGIVNFRNDVYGLDDEVRLALDRSRAPDPGARVARLRAKR